jgi:sugar phosphate isomerase/epimerase/HEAT repeat protein
MPLLGLRHFRRLARPACTGVLALALAGPVAAQPVQLSGDPVEIFRQALKAPPTDLLDAKGKPRDKALDEAARGLVGVGDLRRALALQEWRDEDRDDQIAQIDQKVRKALGDKLQALLTGLLKSPNTVTQLAALQLIADMAPSIRSTDSSDRSSFCKVFTDNLVQILNSSEELPVRTAAARALGRVTPNPQQAVPVLKKALGAPEAELRAAATDGLAAYIATATAVNRGQGAANIEVPRAQMLVIVRDVAPLLGGVLRGGDDVAVKSRALEGLVAAGETLVEMVPDNRREGGERGLAADDQKAAMDVAGPIAAQVDGIAAMLSLGAKASRLNAARLLEDLTLARARLLGRVNNFMPPSSSRPDSGGTIPPRPQPVDPERRLPTTPPPKKTTAAPRVAPGVLLAQAEAPQRPEVLPPPVPGATEIAADVLKQLPAITAALANPDPQVRTAVLGLLEPLGPDAEPATPIFLAATRDPSLFCRWVGARALGRIAPNRDTEIVPALIPLLCDRDLDVRLVALTAIERFGAKGAPAIPELARTTLRGDNEIRIVAIRVLEAVGARADQVVPSYIQGLDNPDARVRIAVMGALQRLGPPAAAAIPALEKQLHDEEVTVREAAADAILSLSDGARGRLFHPRLALDPARARGDHARMSTARPRISVFPKCYFDDLCSGRMPYAEWLRASATLGAEGVEHYDGFFHGPAAVAEARRLLDDAGLASSLLCFSPDFTHPDPAERARQVDRQKAAIDLCVELGIRHCRTLSGQRFPGLTRAEGIDRTVEGITRCLGYAEARGVVLCLENHYKDGNWSYPEFAQAEDVFLEVLGRIDSPWLGVQYDPSNATVGGYDPVRFLERVRQRVVSVHASDRYVVPGATLDELRQSDGTIGYSDKLRHGETGRGLNDYDAIFRLLADAGFAGWISVEDGVNGLDELRRSVDFLKRKRAEYYGGV